MASTLWPAAADARATGTIDRAAGFSVGGWVRYNVVPAANSPVLAVWGPGDWNHNDVLGSTTSGPFGLYLGGSRGYALLSTGYTPTTAAWFYWCLSYTGTTARIRLSTNGRTITHNVSGTCDTTFATNTLYLGANTFGDVFRGQQQYLRAWSSVLSDSQLIAEFTSVTPALPSNLWGSWLLSDQTAGNTSRLRDTSGNGRNFSLVSGALAASSLDAPLILNNPLSFAAE